MPSTFRNFFMLTLPLNRGKMALKLKQQLPTETRRTVKRRKAVCYCRAEKIADQTPGVQIIHLFYLLFDLICSEAAERITQTQTVLCEYEFVCFIFLQKSNLSGSQDAFSPVVCLFFSRLK